jgi:hypothetical protein
MKKAAIASLVSLAAASALAADNCEALREQIEAKITANGVSQFTLSVVPHPAPEGARVLGRCAQGSKAIVYARPVGAAAAPALATPASPASSVAKPPKPKAIVLTECKDGRVITQGDCGK